jgi:hypothetical protein
MKKCKFENLIDEYLFDRLDETQKESFEEHYFNCPPCFKKMEESNEMIAVIKANGDEIFKDVYAPAKIRRSWLEPVLAFLTPRQWAMAAVSAALVLVVAIGVIPNWQSLGENTEYKLFVFHQEELLWSTTTKENFVTLSENIKSLMAPSKKYSWQVKAFSPEGTLIAVSSRVQFNFVSSK